MAVKKRKLKVNDKLEPDRVDTIAVLKDLCQVMSSAPLIMADLRAHLDKLPLPASAQAEPGTDAPAFVRLTLPESSPLTLRALKKEFGTSKQLPRLHRNAPDEYIIRVDLAGTPYTCALIAEKKPGETAVQAVTVRRDIRLE